MNADKFMLLCRKGLCNPSSQVGIKEEKCPQLGVPPSAKRSRQAKNLECVKKESGEEEPKLYLAAKKKAQRRKDKEAGVSGKMLHTLKVAQTISQAKALKPEDTAWAPRQSVTSTDTAMP